MRTDRELQVRTIADLAARCNGPNQFEKFDRDFRALLNVRFVQQVKAEVSNFKRFRKLIDRLITLSIERSQLRMKTDKKQ